MDTKELKNLLKIMRSNGVLSYKTPELELHLAPEFLIVPEEVRQAQEDAGFPQDTLTNEQLMFYSSGGDPQDDPENQGH
jgi:hypothetical protein